MHNDTIAIIPAGAEGRPGLPDAADGLAVFLDIDGTLLDIAGEPDAVRVDPDLPETLARLARRLGGALALITGRPVALVEELFPQTGVPVSGLHGAEWRDSDGVVHGVTPTRAFADARTHLRQKIETWDGVVFEDKGAAFAAHFRLAPQREAEIRVAMAESAAIAGEGWTLQSGKCVIELRPHGRDKGDAVAAFMAQPPFHGRRPLAVGDDVTDEAMFDVVNAMGGLSVRVGGQDRPTLARRHVGTPEEVRRWIARMAG